MKKELTEAQRELETALKNTSKHVSENFDEHRYTGPSTIGFAHISNVNGNGSFVRSIQSLSRVKSNRTVVNENGRYRVEKNGLKLSVTKAHNGGYRVSVSNVREFIDGPEHQRLDVRERLNRLVLEKLQEQGYLEGSYISSRMD